MMQLAIDIICFLSGFYIGTGILRSMLFIWSYKCTRRRIVAMLDRTGDLEGVPEGIRSLSVVWAMIIRTPILILAWPVEFKKFGFGMFFSVPDDEYYDILESLNK